MLIPSYVVIVLKLWQLTLMYALLQFYLSNLIKKKLQWRIHIVVHSSIDDLVQFSGGTFLW
jgi:hypothetical protein